MLERTVLHCQYPDVSKAEGWFRTGGEGELGVGVGVESESESESKRGGEEREAGKRKDGWGRNVAFPPLYGNMRGQRMRE